MGPFVLVWRLAAYDLRRRLTQSVLLLLVIAAATSTLALAFALDGTSNTPWSTTGAATAGPDIMVEAYPAKHPLDELTALSLADSVVATSGPYPMASPVLRTGRIADPVFAEGRDETMPAIDRPYLTAGTWVRPGGVVIERGFAGQLNVHVGSRVTLDDRQFQVAGIAVDTGRGANWRPQLMWVTRDDALRLVSRSDQLEYVLNLRLADPAAAPAFAAAHSSPSLFIATWEQIRSSDEKELTVVQTVLLVGTWLLGMLAIGSVAVLVGGRMIEQTRRVGLIKAAGGTPQFVAVVLLAENLLLALAATVIGLVIGHLVAAVRASPSLSLLTISLLITDVMIVCALALHSSFASGKSTDVMVSQPGLGNPPLARVDSVVLVVTVILVALATINMIFITQAPFSTPSDPLPWLAPSAQPRTTSAPG